MAKLPRADLIKHINRLIERWPKDEVRPDSVSVQRYLRNRLESPAAPPAPRSSGLSSFFSRGKNSQPAQTQQQSQPSQVPEDAPLTTFENIKSLNSLLDNKYQKMYPLPRSLRYPKSQPNYYDRLLQEFEEAPRRSWFGRLNVKVRGFLRMK